MFLIKKGKDSHLWLLYFIFIFFILFPERVRAAPGQAVCGETVGFAAFSAHPRSPESLGLLPVALLMTFFVSPNQPRGSSGQG